MPRPVVFLRYTALHVRGLLPSKRTAGYRSGTQTLIRFWLIVCFVESCGHAGSCICMKGALCALTTLQRGSVEHGTEYNTQ